MSPRHPIQFPNCPVPLPVREAQRSAPPLHNARGDAFESSCRLFAEFARRRAPGLTASLSGGFLFHEFVEPAHFSVSRLVLIEKHEPFLVELLKELVPRDPV